MHRIALATIGLAMLLALPSAALADGAALSATTTRNGPATVVDLTGSGFTADSSVELQVSRNGEALSSETLTTDPLGAFSVTLQYGPGQGGRYTFTATSAEGSASAEVVVVESAGAGVNGTGSTMPSTDMTVPPPGTSQAGSGPALALLLAAFLVSLGFGLAVVAPRTRRA